MLDLHRGRWKVGDFDRWVMIVVQVYFIYQASIRGLDYLGAQPSSSASGLARAEQDAPFGLGLTFWGMVFLLGAAIFIVGASFRWWSWIVTAHLIIAGAYFVVSWGLFATAFSNHYWQGIRTPSGLLGATLLHCVLAVGTAAQSRRSKIRQQGGLGATD